MTNDPHELAQRKRRTIAVWVLGAALAFVVVMGLICARQYLRKGEIGDYQYYYHAAQAVRSGENIYQQHVRQYGYLPAWAIIQSVLVPLGAGGAGAVWALCNTALVMLALWAGVDEAMSRLGLGRDRLVRAVVIAAGVAVLSDEIKTQLALGQTDAAILACLVLALRWLDRWPLASGVLLGFVANFKFQSLIMAPYFAVRGRWSALASTLVSAVGFALSGSLIWGWERNTEYLGIALGSVLKMVGATPQDTGSPDLQPLTWVRSVSVPSVLARLAQAHGWPLGRVALAGTGVAALAATGIAWLIYARRGVSLFAGRGSRADVRSPRGRAVTLLEWSGLIVGALAFSPQTSVRHLYLMIFSVQIAGALAMTARERRERVWLWVAMGALWMVLVLPPGSMLPLDHWWRTSGVHIYVSLALFYLTLWYGLARARALPDSGVREADEVPRADGAFA